MKIVQLYLLILILIFPNSLLFGEKISWGLGGDWGKARLTGIQNAPGWQEGTALTLAPVARDPFSSSSPEGENEFPPELMDLLLLADPLGLRDATGHYRIQGDVETTIKVRARGEASLRLNKQTVFLHPAGGALLSPGTVWDDFSWEFRLLPTNLREGEVLLSWFGINKEGQVQRILIQVSNRRLVWIFENFFDHPDHQKLTITLESPPLVPGEWRHHLLRFQGVQGAKSRINSSGSSPGLLEYLVDGVPADTTYTTMSGKEDSVIFLPQVGEISSEPLQIGRDFTGYLDEFRLSRFFVENPLLGIYTNHLKTAAGVGTTEIIDMGYPDSTVKTIRTLMRVPSMSRISLYAAFSNDREEIQELSRSRWSSPSWGMTPSPWLPLTPLPEEGENRPGESMQWVDWAGGLREKNPSGRFLIFRFVLEPDPGRDRAPVLAALETTFQPRRPPSPPQNLAVNQEESGDLTLSWANFAEADITGWWLYWGIRPGEYIPAAGKDSWGGSLWIPKEETRILRSRRFFTWPSWEGAPPFLYLSLRAAYKGGGPGTDQDALMMASLFPQDDKSLSNWSEEVFYRPPMGTAVQQP